MLKINGAEGGEAWPGWDAVAADGFEAVGSQAGRFLV